MTDQTDGDCQQCGRPTDGTLCTSCTAKLVKVLGELPALMHELEQVVTRQDHLEAITARVYGALGDVAAVEYRLIPPRLRSSQGRIALPSTPWAYGVDAAAMLREARLQLLRAVRDLVDAGVRDAEFVAPVDLGELVEGPAHQPFLRLNELANPKAAKPAPTTCGHSSCVAILAQRQRPRPPGACVWLIRHRVELAQFDRAGELADRLTWHRNRIEAAIDRREPDVFLGRCDAEDVKIEQHGQTLTAKPAVCGVELYAHAEDRNVTCPACGWLYSVPRRKAKLLEMVYDEHRPIRQVADAVSGLLTDDRGELVECTESMVRNYLDRGRLVTRGVDQERRQLVRVGDVVELIRAKMERDKLRRAKRPRRVSA